MRKFFFFIFLLLVLGSGYLGYAHLSGGAIPTFGLPIGGEKAHIRAVAKQLFENIKFKNTEALKDLVKNDESGEEINNFISKTLGVEPEDVDIQKVVVEELELDTAQKRARARVRLHGRELKNDKPLELNKVIYLYRDDKKWLVDTRVVSH